MKSDKAKALISQIKSAYEQEGFSANTIIDQMKELRELAKEEQDPFVTKLLRLSYEHIESNGSFEVEIDEEEQVEGADSFQYLMMLIEDSENKYNRESISEMIDALV